MPISNDTKNILKGVGIATIVFAAIYFYSVSSKKDKIVKDDKHKDEPITDVVKEEVVIEVVNPDVVKEEVPKDVFVPADGVVAEPLSEKAEDALRWFVANKYNVKPFANKTDSEIIETAEKSGWDGMPIVIMPR